MAFVWKQMVMVIGTAILTMERGKNSETGVASNNILHLRN